MNVIGSYVKAGGYHLLSMICVGHTGFIAFQVVTNLWLSKWADDQPQYVNGTYDNSMVLYRLSIYEVFGVGQVIFVMLEVFAIAYGCYFASSRLHYDLLNAILRTPMSFFDTTPLGRIMNRFSQDLDVLDSSMPSYLGQWLLSLSPIITTIILITYTNYIFFVIFVPLTFVFLLVKRVYIRTARQLRRIESVQRSPIYTHLDESVQGASSIRAYRREQDFISKMDELIDNDQKPWYLINCCLRWLSICMEMIASLCADFP